jgi:DNA-binding transcriptional LysR family regulator
MEWNDLEVFLEVSASNSMRKASVNLHLAQSAVSKRIHRLEHELDLQLFQRSAKGVQLTKHGESLLEFATKSFNTLKDGITFIKSDNNPTKMRIGATPPLVSLLLPYIIQRFQNTLKGVALDITTMKSKQILHSIRSGELHVGFTSSSETLTGVKSKLMFQQDIWLIYSPKLLIELNIKAGEKLPLHLLPSLPFILPKDPGSARRLIDEMFLRTFSKLPNVAYQIDSSSQLSLKLVELNLGCTILSMPAFRQQGVSQPWIKQVNRETETLGFQSLTHLFPKRSVYFVYRDKMPDNFPSPETLIRSLGDFSEITQLANDRNYAE